VATALAQIPRTISFQGVLADAAGTLIPDGPQDLTISIYDIATGGTPLFSETQRVTVVRGVFNAIIGATDPAGIPAAIAFDMPYYLGVRVGSGTELAPRTPFTSVPYALNAAMAQRAIVADRADSATWAQTSVTSDTTMNIVGGHVASVNGQQGAIEFLGQGATTVTRNGNQITIRSTDAVGGIQRIDNFDGSLVIDPPQGPFVTMFIREQGVQTHHLRDLSITTQKIIDGAVTNAKLGALSISNDKIQTGAVDSRTILDGTIITADLADNSVTSPKIVDGQVLTQDIGLNQVIASRIGTEGATTGFALLSNGTSTPYWANPITANIPFSGTFNAAQTLWDLTNIGTGGAGRFVVGNPASSATALLGSTNGTGIAVLGEHFATTGTAAGVHGTTNSTAANAVGVMGVVGPTAPGGFSAGVRGVNNGTGGLGIGVYGSQGGSGWGVYGTTPSGIGVHGNSSSGFGMYGLSGTGTGVYGLSTSGEAGRFEITNSANSSNALTGNTNGAGAGISAINTGTGKGANVLIANTGNSSPALDVATLGTGIVGLFNNNNVLSPAMTIAAQTLGTGPAAQFSVNNLGSTANALEVFNNGNGRAILGRRGVGSGISLGQTEAIRGDNTNGPGVAGTANTAVGVYGTSLATHGVWGVSVTAANAGVLGRNDVANGFGVWGQSFGGGIGVYGTSQTGNAAQFDITNAASTGDAIRVNQSGLGRGVYSLINNTSNIVAAVRGETNGGGYGIFGQATGNGNAGFFQISNPASFSSVMNVTTNGIGSGITVQLTNASNGARGLDVLQAGVGPGVFATSAGGNAVWGITSSISAAGVIGDNTFGEAVVGRNRGGNGVGAVVGRNDSSGYGVRGFNTKDGIGVLGQTGISGGTGVGGRFENVNAANGNDALQAATNGTGWAANFTNSNNSSGSRALRVSTTAGQGGNAITIANGTLSLSREGNYASNTVVDDAVLVVNAAGNVTIPTGPPLVDGATVWVVNNSGAGITILNTTAGGFGVGPGRAIQLLFVSTVSGANWIPVEP
jgi:hypothetical protein